MTKNTTPTNEAGHGLPELPALPSLECGPHTGHLAIHTEDQIRRYAEGYGRACYALALSRGVPAERMAPVQGYTPGIPWSMHLEAYDVYCKRYGKQPALIDLEGRNCRGGFGTNELDMFIPGWRERLSEFNAMKARIAELEAMIAAAPAAAGAQGEAIAWTRDAETWGNALNEAAWTFVDECPEKSALLFNNTKGPLRAAILKYAELVGAATPQPAAADGGVRERARVFLAEVLDGYDCPIEPENINIDGTIRTDIVLAALEQALTQQPALSSHRQAGDESIRSLHARFMSDTSGLSEEWQDWRNDFARDIRALVEKGAGS